MVCWADHKDLWSTCFKKALLKLLGSFINEEVKDASFLLLEKKIYPADVVLYHAEKVRHYINTGSAFERKKFLAMIPKYSQYIKFLLYIEITLGTVMKAFCMGMISSLQQTCMQERVKVSCIICC